MRGFHLPARVVAIALAALVAPGLMAAEPDVAEPALDEELLEFLGSLDLDDEEWVEYLMRTDIRKVAKTGPVASPPATPKPSAPAGHSDTAKRETKEDD